MSLAIHAVLAAAFMHVRPLSRTGTDESAHVISIALVAAPQEPKAESETPRPQVTPPEPKEPVVEQKTPPPRPMKKPAVAIQKPAPAERVTKAAPSAPDAAPADGVAAFSSGALETRAQGYAAYGRLVWKKIAEAKPAGLHRKGSVDIRFAITSEGALRSVEVLHPNGDAELEALARQTLSRAAPFPPPPPELGQGDIVFEILFNFQ